MEKEKIILLAARASRLENQDAIDAAIVNMLADPKEVQIGRNVASLTKFPDLFFFVCGFLNLKIHLLCLGSCRHQGSALFALQSSGQAHCDYVY